jgi:hypothetical protein
MEGTMNTASRVRSLLTALVLTGLACSLIPSGESPTSPPSTPPAVTPTTHVPEGAGDVYPPAFASYNLQPVRLPESFTGYDLPLDLSGVPNLGGFELSDEQRALLSQNGFVVDFPGPEVYHEFYQIYEDFRYSSEPMFVTTDSVLHVYHLLFDKILRDLEVTYFIPTLESLTATMLEASQEQLGSLIGSPLEEPARRNVAFFAVASRLLGNTNPAPADVSAMVDAEYALIDGAGGPSQSPIWFRDDLAPDLVLIEDYSQYIPRGHYTRSEDLERYFRTMMWYGRLTYRLVDPFETQRALLIAHALRTATAADGTPAVDLWQRIYEPTTFLVGKADDLSYFEYGALADEVFGEGAAIEAYGDADRLAAFLAAAEELPPPQVNSMWVWIWQDQETVTKGFRFMGQRFTIDAYVFQQMIWRRVGTSDNPRGLPTALDFFAALGSDDALQILEDLGHREYANFDTQMERVRGELAALETDSWTQNVYWAWLYALQPLITVHDERFPEFMRTEAWRLRDLNAALGSYTELKHDTILYAKQVMAEMGGGPPEVIRGYVEPNPEAFARMLALAEMTRDGLQARGLLSSNIQGALANLIDLLGFLRRTAEAELAGETLTDEDYLRIQFVGGELEALTLAAADCEEEGPACRDLQDQQAALVADIATGLSPEFPGIAALEEGVGRPTRIYVVLPDSTMRLAVGAVFSYYEFVVPASDRLTDEAWQAMLEAGTNPPPPGWTEAFMAP